MCVCAYAACLYTSALYIKKKNKGEEAQIEHSWSAKELIVLVEP